ncbi:hypothetical protein XI03_11245 [Bradyrhizobium sp. CCBAU 65884]|nr:hypothetical protein [Bradyrhizobium sp. CCBAU 65884]
MIVRPIWMAAIQNAGAALLLQLSRHYCGGATKGRSSTESRKVKDFIINTLKSFNCLSLHVRPPGSLE